MIAIVNKLFQKLAVILIFFTFVGVGSIILSKEINLLATSKSLKISMPTPAVIAAP